MQKSLSITLGALAYIGLPQVSLAQELRPTFEQTTDLNSFLSASQEVVGTVTALQTQPASLFHSHELLANDLLSSDGDDLAQPIPVEPLYATIQPQLTVRHDSSGGGYDGISSLNYFLPLDQVTGSNVLYSSGSVRLDNDGLFSGSVLLGHRLFNPKSDRLWGVYGGLDVRDKTFQSGLFSQLALGVETLGNWDFRLNGYIPLDSDDQRTTNRFSGNSLLVDVITDQGMGGFDFEGGTKIANFGKTGTVRGFLGGYYLDSTFSSVFGGKLRLELRPNRHWSVNLGVQNDALFGTNFTIGVEAILGGTKNSSACAEPEETGEATEDENRDCAQQGESTQGESTWTRMGNLAFRSPTIVVDRNVAAITALDASTGQPVCIVHVTPGVTGGSGVFEDPYGEIVGQALVDAANSCNIVYVQSQTSPTLTGGFTIPTNVQVLSAFASHTLSVTDGTTNFGTVTLPGSGSGIRPVIGAGTITMGTNTTLDGFQIEPGANDGITVGSGTSNFNIRNNNIVITSTGGGLDGIVLDVGAAGTISGGTISGNTITSAAGDATTRAQLLALRTTGGTISNTTISGNTMSASGVNGEGIELDSSTGAGTISGVTISNNNIDIAGTAEFLDGIVLNVGAAGTISDTTISGNTMTSTSGAGVGREQSIVLRTAGGTINNTTISGNTINTSGFDAEGIELNGTAGTISNLTISGNTITTTGDAGDGIVFFPSGTIAISGFSVTNNQVVTTGAGGNGVFIRQGVISMSLNGNTFTTQNTANGPNGLPAYPFIQFNNNVCVDFNNNTFNSPVAGIRINQLQVVNLANLTTNNTFNVGTTATEGTLTNVASCP